MRYFHTVTIITKTFILMAASTEVIRIVSYLRMISNNKVVMRNHFPMASSTHLLAVARCAGVPITHTMRIEHIWSMYYGKNRIGILIVPQISNMTKVA